ncbi:MAG: hypothetical protein AAFQ98_01920 [Bacteroidota bacterium]
MKARCLVFGSLALFSACQLFPITAEEAECSVDRVGPFAGDLERCDTGDCALRYYENRELIPQTPGNSAPDSPTSFALVAGEYRVFEFEKVHEDDSLIADDELTEWFRFKVPMDQADFVVCLGNEDYPDWAYWYWLCFCPESTSAVSGFIQGQRLCSNTYELSVSLEWQNMLEQPETLQFTQTYTLAP